MAKSRRHFLATTSLGFLGAAALPTQAQNPAQPAQEQPPGTPPAFGTGPLVGPEVSPTTFAEAQKLGLSCAYYNIEKRYEKSLAERLGVDTKKLKLVPGSTIETIGDKMESLLGVIHLHVLDSTSAAVSEDELNGAVDNHGGVPPYPETQAYVAKVTGQSQPQEPPDKGLAKGRVDQAEHGRDFSEGLGWLIINSQSGGVSTEDQITVLRCALKALQEAFP